METNQKHETGEMKFCPICGHEGHDLTCPVCNEPMEEIDLEMDKVLSEDDKSENGLFADDISLEEEQVKETKAQESEDNADL